MIDVLLVLVILLPIHVGQLLLWAYSIYDKNEKEDSLGIGVYL